MKIFLDDTTCSDAFFPFSLTRHGADVKVGILTIREKWELLSGYSIETNLANATKEDLIIPANILPNSSTADAIIERVKSTQELSAANVFIIKRPWNLFQFNAQEIVNDFDLITKGRISAQPDASNKLSGDHKVFLEKGSKINHAIINTVDGPVYIGENALVMEGCLLKGPLTIGKNAVVKMGTKIYGGTTIGTSSMVGGEIKNSILSDYSNKAHDGYLGDSVIGEWCNMGAGTSNSNVKNTGGNVSYYLGENNCAETGMNKGGLLMGDYSRCAINTSFNTAAVVGVCCNIFGSVNTKKYFHHFSWGDEKYTFEKAIEHINNWKKMKGQILSALEIEKLKFIYNSRS